MTRGKWRDAVARHEVIVFFVLAFKGPTFVIFWYVYALLWLVTGFAVIASRRGGLQTARC
jgi:hypothetical protein